ncbi:MAG: hypothetical protein H7831_08430 [Magnetococcus sp. WYHC-3]
MRANPRTGVETGATIYLNDVAQQKINTAVLSNTGGVATYDVLSLRSPLTTTGTILQLSIECGNVPRPFTGDLGFAPTVNAETGSTITNFGDKTFGTGSRVYFLTGATLWNPAQRLKFGTLTTVPTTSGNNCQLRYSLFDTYGS